MDKEYIEREAAIRLANNHIDKKIDANDIARILAADVEEVVRCKNCKYYAAMITDMVSGNMETASWGICTQPWFNSDEYDVQEDGYCSYGEKKDR